MNERNPVKIGTIRIDDTEHLLNVSFTHNSHAIKIRRKPFSWY